MRFLTLNHALTEQALLESRMDRYMQMFEGVKKIDSIVGTAGYERAKKDVRHTIHWLQREDRIVYYLRLYKHDLLDTFMNYFDNRIKEAMDTSDEKLEAIYRHAHEVARGEYVKSTNKLKKLFGDPLTRFFLSNNFTHWARDLRHYVGVMHQAPPVAELIWNRQQPEELINQMSQLEREYHEKKAEEAQYIDMSKDWTAHKVLEFPDGSVWFNQGRAACDDEASAMGHCGNEPDRDEPDLTLLSYRVPSKDGKWRPSLTFVLNDKTGMLGEMKGRNNDKPQPKYHPYIVALLKQDFIKGIEGGGYRPENNFSIMDLDKGSREELISLKPRLATAYEMYQHEGESDRLAQRIEDEYDADVFTIPEAGSGEDKTPSRKFVVVDDHKDKLEFATVMSANTYSDVGDVAGVILGDHPIEDYLETIKGEPSTHWVKDPSVVLELLVEAEGSDKFNELATYIEDRYPGNDTSDGWTVGAIIRRNEPELQKKLIEVIKQTIMDSAYNRLHEKLSKWFEDPVTAVYITNPDIWLAHYADDGKVYVGANLDTFVEVIQDERFREDWERRSHVSDLIEPNKFDVSNLNFDEWDMSIALEYFNMLEIPKDTHDETD